MEGSIPTGIIEIVGPLGLFVPLVDPSGQGWEIFIKVSSEHNPPPAAKTFYKEFHKNLSVGPDTNWRGGPKRAQKGEKWHPKTSIFDRFYKGFRHGGVPCAFDL